MEKYPFKNFISDRYSSMDKFNSLKIFISVCDNGSFASAAQALGTDASTVSKAISRLEKALEYPLFFRTTRKLKLTTPGHAYLVKVRQVLHDLETCEQQLLAGNEGLEGTLKLNLPVAYGRLYILPLLSKFRTRYPKIDLNITFSDEYVDIVEQGIDLSIRTGTLADSRLVVQQLSPMDFLICASPDYLKTAPPLETYHDFDKHKWVRFKFKQTGKLMPVLAQIEEQDPQPLDPGSDVVTDDGQSLLDLCLSGIGLMQGPHFLFRPQLLNGDLISLFPATQAKGFGVYLLYPKQDYRPKRVQVFIDFLKEELEAIGETANHCWSRELKPLKTWY